MSDLGVLLPFLMFAIVMTGTPGPNNLMVLMSGARVGVLRTMPLACGIALGIGLQLAIVGSGLGSAFEKIPGFHSALSVVGAAYILWLAWAIANSGPLQMQVDPKPPMGLISGAAFQWINPKAWALSISVAATYIPPENHFLNLCIAAVILAAISVPCVGVWALGGLTFRRWLGRPRIASAFNVSMAVILVVATMPAVLNLSI